MTKKPDEGTYPGAPTNFNEILLIDASQWPNENLKRISVAIASFTVYQDLIKCYYI